MEETTTNTATQPHPQQQPSGADAPGSEDDFAKQPSTQDPHLTNDSESEPNGFGTDEHTPKEPEPTPEPTPDPEKEAEASRLKQQGNDRFREGQFAEAIDFYTQALDLSVDRQLRSQCFANRAACNMGLNEFDAVISDCSAALEADPEYIKALYRRAEAYEKLDRLAEALADVQKIVELKPDEKRAAAKVAQLQPIVTERQEKERAEMMGKLKDLGNMFLGKFGLSTENFKMVQDPSTGSYNISFQK